MASDKSHRGNASQFLVAGELCRRGYLAVVTMGNSPNTDVLVSNKDGDKFVHIQVKTFRPGDKTCSLGMRSENSHGENFFWVLCELPEPDKIGVPQFYVIPSEILAKNVNESSKIWFDTPGKKGQVHNPENKFRALALPPKKNLNGWDISPYLNKWILIEKILGIGSNL
jgi:hypothetical protein